MRPLPTIVLCIVLSTLALPQTHTTNKPSNTANKLRSVKASGSSAYTDNEILGASGLQLGQNVAEGDFKEAAQRLGDSGMFMDVLYSFSYSDGGAKVDFQLTDVDKAKLVPAHFDNFVWFNDADLLAALERRVPLFKQLLPVGGKLSDQVAEALQALITEKHLPGRVAFQREAENQNGGKLTAISYRVEEVSLPIRHVEFSGATPEQTAFLTSAARRLIGADYSRSSVAAVAKFDFLPLFLKRGYLKAEFAPSDADVVTQPTTATNSGNVEDQPQSEVEVNAIIPVNPGRQYRISGVTWKGTSVITADEASRLLHLNTGEPADAVALSSDVDALDRLYRTRGYMTAKINPDPLFDDAKSTVHYDIDVSEGDLYKMGELEILGLDSDSRDRLREAWSLRTGEPYNADYTKKFLVDAPRFFPRGSRFSVSVDETLDPKEKVVDVTLHYKAQ